MVLVILNVFALSSHSLTFKPVFRHFSICVLYMLENFISQNPRTVPIQSTHLAKDRSNNWKCCCSVHFIEDALGELTFVYLG